MPAGERRAQIIKASALLISERGYWGLSLQDVADACGITLSGLLYHFASKEVLLIAVLEGRDRDDEEAIGRILQRRSGGRGHNAPEPTMADVCDAIMEQNAGQREVIRLYVVLQAEALTPDHPAGPFFERRQARAIRQLSERVPGNENAVEIARHVLALIDGITIQWLRDPELELQTVWRAVTESLPFLQHRAAPA